MIVWFVLMWAERRFLDWYFIFYLFIYGNPWVRILFYSLEKISFMFSFKIFTTFILEYFIF